MPKRNIILQNFNVLLLKIPSTKKYDQNLIFFYKIRSNMILKKGPKKNSFGQKSTKILRNPKRS